MAKKDAARDPQLAEGRKLLEEWGITLARLRDNAATLSAARERIGQHPAADLALAALLGDWATAEAAQALAAWEGETTDKHLRREIHRSLYKLAQKGVQPERGQPAPVRPLLAPIEPEGYLSGMDGRGDRLVWLVKPKAGGGLHSLSSVVNEPGGMRTAEATEVSRKGLRGMRQELSEKFHLTMVEAPWRYCDFLMYQGYERAVERGGKDVEAYPALRSHLLSFPAPPTDVPLPAGLHREEIAKDETLVATSAQLFEQQEILRWLLDPEQVQSYLGQISQVQESPLVLNRYQQQDRLQTVVDTAIEEYFTGEQGRAYTRRLEETAFFLAATDRPEAAKRAFAVALALRRSERGGRGIPFCEELIRQSIALHYQQERQHEQEDARGALIMKPSEFAARVQAAQAQRRGVR